MCFQNDCSPSKSPPSEVLCPQETSSDTTYTAHANQRSSMFTSCHIYLWAAPNSEPNFASSNGHPRHPHPVNSPTSSATAVTVWPQSQQTTPLCTGMHSLKCLCLLLNSGEASLATASLHSKRPHLCLMANNPMLGFGCSESQCVIWKRLEFKETTHFVILRSSDLLPHQLQEKRTLAEMQAGWPTALPGDSPWLICQHWLLLLLI